MSSFKTKIGLMLLCLPLMASAAAVTQWKIVPEKSHLSFTATQNGAPINGEFKKFSGDIVFSPDELAASHIDINIDMASVSDSYNQLQNTLEGKDWFNVALFPKASFKSTQIVQIDSKTYEAKGNLTIRDKTVPISLVFTQQDYSAKHALMIGSTTLKRIEFGVGQGEWANTETVKDAVKVDFTIDAIPR